MELRKLFLRIMLWALGFAAATGVGAVLFSGGDIVWRVMGTGLVTAAAAGLMIPMSLMIDRKKTRSAGLLGMGMVVAEFIMSLLLIWEVIENLYGSRTVEQFAVTMLFVGIVLAIAMLFLVLIDKSRTLWSARIGLGLCVVVFCVLMVAVWLPRQSRYNNDWWETAGALSLFGVISVLCLIGLGTTDRRNWRWAGLSACAIACAMWLFDIWIGSGSDLGYVTFTTLTCVAAVCAYSNIAVSCPLTDGQRWVLWGTIASVAATAGLIDLMVIESKFFDMSRESRNLIERLTGAAAILASCGSLSLLVLARLNRRVDFELVSVELAEMLIICPRCAKKQKIRIGDAICFGCQLRIHTRIEEPRCPKCDYLLYKLTSDCCPECGTLAKSKIETEEENIEFSRS